MIMKCLCFLFTFFLFGCFLPKKDIVSIKNENLAYRYIKDKKYDKAIPLLSEYCRNCNTNRLIDTINTKLLGDCYFEIKKFGMAIRSYNLLLVALQGEENIEYIKNRISNIYIVLGMFDSSRAILSSAKLFKQKYES